MQLLSPTRHRKTGERNEIPKRNTRGLGGGQGGRQPVHMQPALVAHICHRSDGDEVRPHEAQNDVHASVEVTRSRMMAQHNTAEVQAQVLQHGIRQGVCDILLQLRQLHSSMHA
jgi:hypothetical protein